MKKITFLFLLAISFGFSQSLPITFDESADADYYFTCYDCDFSLGVDPLDTNNVVGVLTSYNVDFCSAQTIDLDQYVDLSDDNNNTITFRIKPVNGTGSGNHLLKFSGGSTPYGVEVPFTTTGADWQDITLNFGPGFRTYRNLIIFPDFFSTQTDIYLIDDIAGAVNVPPRPTPSQGAPVPTIDANKVKSVYGESYTNIAYLYNFSESFREVDIENNGNKALEVDLGYYGAGFQNTDVSSETYVHFDYWTTDATRFAIRVNSESPVIVNDKQYVLGTGGSEPITLDTWTSVFIPLSYYSNLGVNLMDVYQYNFLDAGGIGTVFIDNIYFTSADILGINDYEQPSFKLYPNPTGDVWKVISKNQKILTINVYDAFGKKVLSLLPNTMHVTIDGNKLSTGLYFAKVNTDKGSRTLKLIKN
jgi:hypothetical protein